MNRRVQIMNGIFRLIVVQNDGKKPPGIAGEMLLPGKTSVNYLTLQICSVIIKTAG